MKPNDANIYLESVNKVSNRLAIYGEGDILDISLLKLIYKYACNSETYAVLQRLDEMVSQLQQKDNDICMDVQNPLSAPEYTQPITYAITNQIPSIDGDTITVTQVTFTFALSNFNNNFSDPDGDSFGNIYLKSFPANGTLIYNGVAATINMTIADPTLLVYTRNDDGAYGTSFTFCVSDDNVENPMNSLPATMTVTVEALALTNQPATMGDIAFSDLNRIQHVFTMSEFNAAYTDPENDLIDAIRIDEISDANVGIYTFFGVAVTEGQIITREEINQGAFVHLAPDQNAIGTDSITISVRDEGSLIWVQ